MMPQRYVSRFRHIGLMLFTTLLLCVCGNAIAGPALVIEPKSGLVLYAEDPDAVWHPASLTKLMTAYLTFEALHKGQLTLEDKVTCSAHALKQPPSKIGLPVGNQMTVEKALKALIVKSANDVAVMLAEKVAGTEEAFVKKMNAAAKRLGMTRTHFNNANGLPNDGQVTTARDLATLARELLKKYPQHAYLYSLPEVKFGKRRLRSHNRLLKTFEGADGMKTGFICDSGYNIVASARRGGKQVVAVVLGGRSSRMRNARAAALIEHGFKTYLWKTMFSTPLDQMQRNARAENKPGKMRNIVCRVRHVKRKKRKSRQHNSTKNKQHRQASKQAEKK
jgi:D-alanyl-D-alanine carboxypeptidase